MLSLPLIVRSGHAFLRITQDLNRLDEVFNLIDSINDEPRFSQQFVEAYRQMPSGARALRERPRLGPIDMEALGRLPEGTLGREYVSFMRRNNLDPSALPLNPVHDELSFIEAHMRETHDLWHVVTGFDSDVASELGLQAFYLAQSSSNRVALAILSAGLFNTLVYAFEDAGARMTQLSRGWLLGRQARPLFGTDWKQLWRTPLAEVRASFGLEVEATDALLATGSRPPNARVALA